MERIWSPRTSLASIVPHPGKPLFLCETLVAYGVGVNHLNAITSRAEVPQSGRTAWRRDRAGDERLMRPVPEAAEGGIVVDATGTEAQGGMGAGAQGGGMGRARHMGFGHMGSTRRMGCAGRLNGRGRCRDGFSMIEVLVVIIIIGILAAIVIPMYLKSRDKAKDAAVRDGIHVIQVGVLSYYLANEDVYPPSGSLDVLRGNPTYVDEWPKNLFKGGALMASSSDKGDYTYVRAGSTFTLAGHLAGSDYVVP